MVILALLLIFVICPPVFSEANVNENCALAIKDIDGCPCPNISKDDPSNLDDHKLVDFIRKKVLVPPAPATSSLNLTVPVWNSPVTKVVMEVLRKKRYGFFVETEVNDGDLFSNSMELEEYLGWTGLLLEGDPNRQGQLMTTQRKAWFAPACLSSEPNFMSMTMVRLIHSPFVKRTARDSRSVPDPRFGQFPIECYPLLSLMQALGRTVIDYLSLREEGTFWSRGVIKSIPFDRLTIKVISVDMNSDFLEVSAFLQERGYSSLPPVKTPIVTVVIFVHKSV